MKSKNQAVRSLTTHQLKELADISFAYRRAQSRARQIASGSSDHRQTDTQRRGVAGSADDRIQEAYQSVLADGRPISPARLARLAKTNFDSARRWLENLEQAEQEDGALAAAPVWDLKDRADALRERELARRGREAEVAPKAKVLASPRSRGPNLFEQLVQLLLPKPKVGPTRKEVRENREAEKRVAAEIDQHVDSAAKQAVGETILGSVRLDDVLKELERRGVTYKPPVDQRGVLTIEESDLVPCRAGEHAKLRPGIASYLKEKQDELKGVTINTMLPVDLGSVNMPHGFVESIGPVRANFFNIKELHTVGDVTVDDFIRAGEIQAKGNIAARDILTSECTVYGNINGASSLTFISGSTQSKQLITGNVQCGHITSEDDRQVDVSGELFVRGNCKVPRLSARDLHVGWELQDVKDLYVAGKASITRLSKTIDSDANLRGAALQEYVDQLKDMRKEELEKEVLNKVKATTAVAGKDGTQMVEWTTEEMQTNAFKEYVLGESPEEGQIQETGAKQSQGVTM
jgi:hypothetical protein